MEVVATLCLFHFLLQFLKRYLNAEDLNNIEPGTEGALIGSQLMTYSTLSNHCIKCGGLCEPDQEPIKICTGSCRPHRYFHQRCLPDSQKKIKEFKCQICDPSLREEYCMSCGDKPDNTILNCKDMCEAFVHRRCLPAGMTTYRCGICML